MTNIAVKKHRWGLYFAVEDFSRPKPKRQTYEGIDVSQLKDIRPVCIEGVRLYVTIHGLIADVTCQATFHNYEADHIDGFFLFPVESNAAFYRFEALLPDRKVVAVSREKGEQYELALLEELHGEGIMLEENASDVFTCNLGVVAPDDQVEITFQYSVELPIMPEGDVQFLFPSFVPRVYQGKYLEMQYEQQSLNGEDYGFDFYFQGIVAGNYVIRDVLSRELLEIEYLDETRYNAKLELSGGYLPNRDFSFLIKYADIESPHILIQEGMPDGPYQHVVMQNRVGLFSLFHTLNKTVQYNKQREFIICVDKSGPMYGAKLQLARESLLYLLKSLPQGCYFNVITFGASFTPLFKSSRIYNQYNVMKAIKMQLKLRSDMTKPDLLSVLQHVYSQPVIAGYPKQIFLLTDGSITNTRDCVDFVVSRSDYARVFSLGIGDMACKPLIGGLARSSNGKAHYLKITEKPYNKILECMKQALQPGLTELELVFDTPAGVTALTIPPTIPSTVFAEEKLSIYILFRGEPNDPADTFCSVTLSGLLGKDNFVRTLNFDLREGLLNDNMPLHRLALKTEIKDLEKAVDNALGADDMLENQYHVIQASLAANVASRFTPLIGIDDGSGQEVEGYPIIRIRPEDNPYNIAASRMDLYTPSTGSVYKSVSRLTLSRPGVTPNNFVRGIFDSQRTYGNRTTDSRIHDFSDIGDSDDMFESPPRPPPAVADLDSDLALSEVYMEVKNKDDWASFKDSLKEPQGLLRFQHPDGYWFLDKKVAYAFGSTITEVKKENPLRDDYVWTTVLAVNWLRTNFRDRKGTWEQAERRALTWLRQRDLEDYSLEELLELAEGLTHLDGHVHFAVDKLPEQRQISTIEEEMEEEHPMTYLRTETISTISEDLDNMDEHLYVDDNVDDLPPGEGEENSHAQTLESEGPRRPEGNLSPAPSLRLNSKQQPPQPRLRLSKGSLSQSPDALCSAQVVLSPPPRTLQSSIQYTFPSQSQSRLRSGGKASVQYPSHQGPTPSVPAQDLLELNTNQSLRSQSPKLHLSSQELASALDKETTPRSSATADNQTLPNYNAVLSTQRVDGQTTLEIPPTADSQRVLETISPSDIHNKVTTARSRRKLAIPETTSTTTDMTTNESPEEPNSRVVDTADQSVSHEMSIAQDDVDVAPLRRSRGSSLSSNSSDGRKRQSGLSALMCAGVQRSSSTASRSNGHGRAATAAIEGSSAPSKPGRGLRKSFKEKVNNLTQGLKRTVTTKKSSTDSTKLSTERATAKASATAVAKTTVVTDETPVQKSVDIVPSSAGGISHSTTPTANTQKSPAVSQKEVVMISDQLGSQSPINQPAYARQAKPSLNVNELSPWKRSHIPELINATELSYYNSKPSVQTEL